MATSKKYLILKGDTLSYSITKEGFEPIVKETVVETPEVIEEELTPLYTLTINPTPADATVILTATGYTQVGNTITVAEGTSVHYNVSKEDYETQEDDVIVDENKTIDVELRQGREIDVSDYEYTLTDGVVTLNKFIGSGTSVVIPNV